VLPGFGDQREIELLVESGLTVVEAIQIATENGARYLGQQDRIGTLSPGKQADLVVTKLGITKRIGWHTFRHTYSTLLRSTGAELKIMQELLRHSTIRVTLDTYTQAVTSEKRNAQRQLSRSCSEKKRRRRKLCLEKLYFVYLFCAFLCPRENGALSVSS